MAHLYPILAEDFFTDLMSPYVVRAEALHAKVVDEPSVNCRLYLVLDLSVRDVVVDEPESY